MDGINFVALDVETANNKKRGSICSIGLAKFINGEISETYETLINPEEKFDGYNIYIHGITEDAVKNSPTYPEISQDILKFIDGLPVVMHNAPFDSGNIRACNEKYNIREFYMEYFCSYALSKETLLDEETYRLKDLAKKYNIPLKHHNALSDAQASGLLILELMRKSNAQDLAELLKNTNYTLGVIRGFTLGRFLKENLIASSQQSTEEYVNLVDKLDFNLFDETHPFYRKFGVVTGELKKCGTQNDALLLFESAGGLREKLKPKITKKTNFLIMGEQDLDKLNGKDESEKITKARKYLEKGQDIELLGEDDFLRMVQLPITEAEQDNLITEVMQDNLKKITSTNGFTFIIDDMSSDRDKRQGIYRGDNILLSRRKTLDPVTPLFAKDAQTVRHENVSEITTPNDTERGIFHALQADQELTDEQKEYIKSNYVR